MPTHDLWMAAFHDSEGNIHQLMSEVPRPKWDSRPTPAGRNPRYKRPPDLRYPATSMHDLNYFRDHLDLVADMAKKARYHDRFWTRFARSTKSAAS